MPIVQSLKVYRGEDITINATMTPARDITGWVISMTVAKAYDINNKVFQLTATITSGPNGTYSIIIPSALLNINPDKYVYDIFRTSPGNLRILNIGDFIIGPDARNP